MINAILLQDSLNTATDSRLTSFQWDYPRFIHAEVMTHRLFSRNAGSSRAIPVLSAIDLAREQMVEPVFKYNQSGMQPGKYLSQADMEAALDVWRKCAFNCIEAAKELQSLKVHKQWANRMLEWFSPIRIVITSTDWDNFLWLRNDFEAQDEIEILAYNVEKQLNKSQPVKIALGDAHVPFVDRVVTESGFVDYSVDGEPLKMTDALKVSASVCGQMSYRKSDTSLAKAEDMYDKFMRGRRVHASPFEHQAIAAAADISFVPKHLDPGITHFDRQGRWYSANLRGWVQYRHLIPRNTCTNLETARGGC